MYTDAKHIRYLLGAVLAEQLPDESREAYENWIVYAGQKLLPWRERFPVANDLYDLFVLQDQLVTSENPKKLLDQVYPSIKNWPKRHNLEDFRSFYCCWVLQNFEAKNSSYTKTAVLLSNYAMCLYGGPFCGPLGDLADEPTDICKEGPYFSCDTLSCVTFATAAEAIVRGGINLNLTRIREKHNEGFRKWLCDQNDRSTEQWIEMIKYLCHRHGHSHIYEIFGASTSEEVSDLLMVNLVAAKKVNSDTQSKSKIEEYIEIIPLLVQKRYSWDAVYISDALTVLQPFTRKLLMHNRYFACQNQAILLLSPVHISLNPFAVMGIAMSIESYDFAQSFADAPCPPDILMHRTFYIRDNGLLLTFNEQSIMQTLYMKEVHTADYHYLWVTATICKKGIQFHRNYILPFENIQFGLSYFQYNFDLEILAFLFSFLGVKNLFLESMDSVLRHDTKREDSAITMETTVKWMIERIPHLEQLEYDTVLPGKNYALRTYKHKHRKTGDRKQSEYVGETMREIGEHIRKLPAGYNASDEARRKARERCIFLPQGHTFVSAFRRNHKITNAALLQGQVY